MATEMKMPIPPARTAPYTPHQQGLSLPVSDLTIFLVLNALKTRDRFAFAFLFILGFHYHAVPSVFSL